MWDFVTTHFAELHGWMFQTVVQPALFQLGMMRFDEVAFEGTELFLIGVIQVALLYVLFRPLEALAPAELWDNRRDVRTDVFYTLLAKLGILPLLFFFLLTPAFDELNSALRMRGIIPPNLEDLLPALQGSPVLSAFTYLMVLDFSDYWRHRFQHRFNLWWALHALHHSQRQMSFWTDDREHLLDQMIAGAWRAVISLLIGAPPVQFLTVTLISGAVESFSHANVKLSFGAILDRVVVSPHFHRIHHAIAIGHEGKHFGCNFAAVFSLWDVLFRTANFSPVFPPTGIADQLTGRDYGQGFWAQQWLGLRRIGEAAGLLRS